MDKYKELAKRLRKAAEVKRLLDQIDTASLMDEAADAIEELLKVQDHMGDDIAMMNEELLNAEKEAQRVERVGNAFTEPEREECEEREQGLCPFYAG